jgi:hypothetical protein
VEPNLNRGEVGSFVVYEANWSEGRRWPPKKRELENDLIAEGPFQVITAQEADPAFVAKLTSSDVGGGWMLVTGKEEGHTLLIGARASLVKEVKMLEWHRLVDGEYRLKNKPKGGQGLGLLAGDAGGGGVEPLDGRPGVPPLLDLPHAPPHGEKGQGLRSWFRSFLEYGGGHPPET